MLRMDKMDKLSTPRKLIRQNVNKKACWLAGLSYNVLCYPDLLFLVALNKSQI